MAVARASPTCELCSQTTTLAGPLSAEVVDQRVEGCRHVPVTEVPGGHLGAVHLVVVLLGITHQYRVLLGVELFVVGDPTVAPEISLSPSPEFQQLGDHFVLAGRRFR